MRMPRAPGAMGLTLLVMAVPAACAAAEEASSSSREFKGRGLLRLAFVPTTTTHTTTQPPLQLSLAHAGGGHCHRDVDCGWYDPHVAARHRLDMPSGNGARCSNGRCVCSNSSADEKYGCPRCTAPLKPKYSYSDTTFLYTTEVKDAAGKRFDVCTVPVGGKPCRPGMCARNSSNLTVMCAGDYQCDTKGGGSGVCVGEEEGPGFCVCRRGFFCRDCSLQLPELLRGEKCGAPVSGGAACQSHAECSGTGDTWAGFCAPANHLPSDVKEDKPLHQAVDRIGHVITDDRPFCQCAPFRKCPRCEQTDESMANGTGACMCDTPRITPAGGYYDPEVKGSLINRVRVGLTDPPWDSGEDCIVLYIVYRSEQNWTNLPWPEEQEAFAALRENGTSLPEYQDGKTMPVLLEYSGRLRSNGNMTKNYFYVYAVAVPSPNSRWRFTASKVARSELFVLSAAHFTRHRFIPLVLMLLSPWSLGL